MIVFVSSFLNIGIKKAGLYYVHDRIYFKVEFKPEFYIKYTPAWS